MQGSRCPHVGRGAPLTALIQAVGFALDVELLDEKSGRCAENPRRQSIEVLDKDRAIDFADGPDACQGHRDTHLLRDQIKQVKNAGLTTGSQRV